MRFASALASSTTTAFSAFSSDTRSSIPGVPGVGIGLRGDHRRFGGATASPPPSSRNGLRRDGTPSAPTTTDGAFALRALIYYPDGEGTSALSEHDDIDDVFGFNATTAAAASLVESVSRTIEADALLRIGCAFAPPPHGTLHPRDALGARIVRADGGGVEIAVARDGGSGGGAARAAVEILASIPFPKSFDEHVGGSGPGSGSNGNNHRNDGAALEEFVLTNMRSLDRRAKEEILAYEQIHDCAQADSDRLEEQKRIMRELRAEPAGYSGDDDALPDWWTFPNLNRPLEEECATLKNLLNDDEFATDIVALFEFERRRGSALELESSSDGRTDDSAFAAFRACAASVGPSGLYLRAFAGRGVGTDDERYGNEALAVRFRDGEVRSAEALRERVLRIVRRPEENGEANEKRREDDTTVSTVTEKEEDRCLATRKKDAVQRTLLEAALRIRRTATLQATARKEEAFRRRLLESRIRIDLGNNDAPLLSSDAVVEARRQPKSPEVEAALKRRYAAIDDVGERAYAILKDLTMV